jgi:putative phosphoribosyl transferase
MSAAPRAADSDQPAESPRFRDRREAGRELGRALGGLAGRDPIIVALPRGGVPVGYEVARALGAPLDIGLVRKLGAPMQPELGIGALGEGGEPIVDREAVEGLGISGAELEQVIESETRELERRRRLYRPGNPALDLGGRVVILVDDGLATGVTAIAAARVLRARGAREVIFAVPVCPPGPSERVGRECDELICLRSPEPFYGVGGAYEDFAQTTDEEVIELLARARSPADSAAASESEVSIPAADVELAGTLEVPSDPEGMVVFVHGSGSSRLSPRNLAVAEQLNRAGFATLLFDLLTEAEAATRANVFDIELLASRLRAAITWIRSLPELRGLPIGLFGASTGAAAALVAAAGAGDGVATVVSRGGRPDLAGGALPAVGAPTLLIVGGEDRQVLGLNRRAAKLLGGPHVLAVIPGAGHLFEEPGALTEVAELATRWFGERFAEARAQRAQQEAGRGR